MPQPPLLLDMLQASLQKIGVRLEHADPGDAMPLRIARGALLVLAFSSGTSLQPSE
jgi:hypothetical protein